MTSGVHKLVYPLAAAKFSEQQCTDILKSLLAARLPAAGIVQTFFRSVLHGPYTLQGWAFPNLHTEQMTTQNMTILR